MRHLVIVPTYNEAENIERLISELLVLDESFHVLVVDDGSPDGTADLVLSSQGKFPGRVFLLTRPQKLGLGTAYILGFTWALQEKFDFIYEMDADFSHLPEDLYEMSRILIQNNVDLVVGSRYIGGVRIMNWPMRRLILSYGASIYTRWITGLPIFDSTAGFMGYRASIFKSIQLEKINAKGYFFQILMKYLVWKSGGVLQEYPIVFHERRDGQTKMSKSIIWEALISVAMLPLMYRKYLVARG